MESLVEVEDGVVEFLSSFFCLPSQITPEG